MLDSWSSGRSRAPARRCCFARVLEPGLQQPVGFVVAGIQCCRGEVPPCCSRATVFLSHIAPALASSHQSGNSVFLSYHSSSSVSLPNAVNIDVLCIYLSCELLHSILSEKPTPPFSLFCFHVYFSLFFLLLPNNFE